uniref:Uncharacterized protein n=1 Tax=Schizaphis graminum TaxID=13262 RepID=A0A2S2NIF9_SCHGA
MSESFFNILNRKKTDMSDSFFSTLKKNFDAKTTGAEQCMSPDLFPDTYNPAGYALRVVEHGDQDQSHLFGFEAGQRFPRSTPAADSLNILELLSTEFPRDNEILNDAQSFHWSHTGWPSSDDDDDVACYKILHWKKVLLSRFDLDSM